MNSKSIIGAIVGGVVGALIWAAILHFTNYEVGLVAWAIGGLVGFASASLGGFGAANGGLCALVAVLSIFAGKMIVIKSQISDLEAQLKPAFEVAKYDAEAFAKLTSENQYPQFMIDHDYTEATSPDQISGEDEKMFRADIPMLQEMAEDGISYKKWIKTIIPMGAVIKDSFGAMDILFLFLGVATAFKIGSGLGEEVA